MNELGMRLGVFGGTFNPVHHGHLLMAREAAERLGLDRMLLLPNARSPLRRGEPLPPGETRLEMLRLAVEGESGLEASDLEIHRPGLSYTVDTLEELAERVGGARLTFFVGADSLDTLDRWVRIERIVELAEVAVLPRPGASAEEALGALAGRVPEVAEGVRLLPFARRVELSSTEIRRRVADGRSIRWMTPDSVCDFIRDQGLYRLQA